LCHGGVPCRLRVKEVTGEEAMSGNAGASTAVVTRRLASTGRIMPSQSSHGSEHEAERWRGRLPGAA
jgi:hypothetical protein